MALLNHLSTSHEDQRLQSPFFHVCFGAREAAEREAIAHVFASDDATEGIVAFGDKRTPAFQGAN